MSREIKFRAWDKNNKYLIRSCDISHFDKQNLYWYGVQQCHDGEFEQTQEITRLKDIELMQYTGLKDKNGVEIYEGDLFKPDSLVNPFCLEVKYDTMSACFEPFGNSEYADVARLGEVIGNIYENPELIK